VSAAHRSAGVRTWLAIGAMLLIAAPVVGQSGGYDLSHYTVANGGTTSGTAGTFTLNGTAGQPDAGMHGGAYTDAGGFWAGLLPAPTATVTPSSAVTATRTSTPTVTRTPTLAPTPTGTNRATATNTATRLATATRTTRTATPTATATRSSSGTPTATVTPSPLPSATLTATGTPSVSPTPTATPSPGPCGGDCNDNQHVAPDEPLTLVNIALGNALLSACTPGDINDDGRITVDEILTAVNNALKGCP